MGKMIAYYHGLNDHFLLSVVEIKEKTLKGRLCGPELGLNVGHVTPR